MIMNYQSILGLIVALGLFSCEKVIEIDLNESDPQIVIEALLKEGTEDFSVHISQSTSYFTDASPGGIDDADVRLIDGDGQAFSIPAKGDGYYEALIEAKAGQSYRLEVQIGETIYQASTVVPARVDLVELETQFQAENAFQDEGYLLFSRFQDDIDQLNYYRLLYSVNDTLQNDGDDLQVVDDRLFNGGFARVPLFRKIFYTGDRVAIELRHIDESGFTYYNALADIVSSEEGGGPNGGSAAPGNPTTNWDQGALGVFTAYASDNIEVTIP